MYLISGGWGDMHLICMGQRAISPDMHRVRGDMHLICIG
jgi:hypothetical protein